MSGGSSWRAWAGAGGRQSAEAAAVRRARGYCEAVGRPGRCRVPAGVAAFLEGLAMLLASAGGGSWPVLTALCARPPGRWTWAMSLWRRTQAAPAWADAVPLALGRRAAVR